MNYLEIPPALAQMAPKLATRGRCAPTLVSFQWWFLQGKKNPETKFELLPPPAPCPPSYPSWTSSALAPKLHHSSATPLSRSLPSVSLPSVLETLRFWVKCAHPPQVCRLPRSWRRGRGDKDSPAPRLPKGEGKLQWK